MADVAYTLFFYESFDAYGNFTNKTSGSFLSDDTPCSHISPNIEINSNPESNVQELHAINLVFTEPPTLLGFPSQTAQPIPKSHLIAVVGSYGEPDGTVFHYLKVHLLGEIKTESVVGPSPQITPANLSVELCLNSFPGSPKTQFISRLVAEIELKSYTESPLVTPAKLNPVLSVISMPREPDHPLASLKPNLCLYGLPEELSIVKIASINQPIEVESLVYSEAVSPSHILIEIPCVSFAADPYDRRINLNAIISSLGEPEGIVLDSPNLSVNIGTIGLPFEIKAVVGISPQITIWGLVESPDVSHGRLSPNISLCGLPKEDKGPFSVLICRPALYSYPSSTVSQRHATTVELICNHYLLSDLGVYDDSQGWAITWVPGEQEDPISVSCFSNFAFLGLTNFKGKIFGLKTDGVYLLEGDTDNGSPITTAILIDEIDHSSPHEKEVLRLQPIMKRRYTSTEFTNNSVPKAKLENEDGTSSEVYLNIEQRRFHFDPATKGVELKLIIQGFMSIAGFYYEFTERPR